MDLAEPADHHVERVGAGVDEDAAAGFLPSKLEVRLQRPPEDDAVADADALHGSDDAVPQELDRHLDRRREAAHLADRE